jgi:hypothetical protein
MKDEIVAVKVRNRLLKETGDKGQGTRNKNQGTRKTPSHKPETHNLPLLVDLRPSTVDILPLYY